MNINSVSFQANSTQERIKRQQNQNNMQYRNTSRVQSDSFNHQSTQRSNNTRQTHKKRRPAPFSYFLKGCATGAIAAGTLVTAIFSNSTAKLPKTTEIAVGPNTTMEEFVNIAEVYGVDPLALIDYNHLDWNDVEVGDTIIIPSDFNNLQEEISSTEAKLRDKKLTDTKRASLVEKLANLYKKQELQDSIATVYTDGEFIYYELKRYEKDQYPDNLPEEYRNRINVEDFKQIFDIKDGAIKDNNDITFTWGLNEYGGYKDYTTTNLYPGMTIKVPMDSVKTSDINFDY